MEKFDNLVKELNDLKIHQTSIDWRECIPTELWYSLFEDGDNFEEVAYGLNDCEHRHYEESTSVIKIHGRFLGIRHVNNMFSEMSSVGDVYHHLDFFEMKEVTVTSYEEI